MAWDFGFASWIKKKARQYTDSVALNGVPVNYPRAAAGRWQVFDPAANAYIDTGIYARGTKISIAANGNWQVSEDDGATWTDTGVQAEARGGSDITPISNMEIQNMINNL